MTGSYQHLVDITLSLTQHSPNLLLISKHYSQLSKPHSEYLTLLSLLLLKEWVMWILSSWKLSYQLSNDTCLHRELITGLIFDPPSLKRGLGILPEKEAQDNSLLWTVWSLSCWDTAPLHCQSLARQASSWMLYLSLTWSKVVWDTEYSSICKFSLFETINRKILAREEEQIWYCSIL